MAGGTGRAVRGAGQSPAPRAALPGCSRPLWEGPPKAPPIDRRVCGDSIPAYRPVSLSLTPLASIGHDL